MSSVSVSCLGLKHGVNNVVLNDADRRVIFLNTHNILLGQKNELEGHITSSHSFCVSSNDTETAAHPVLNQTSPGVGGRSTYKTVLALSG